MSFWRVHMKSGMALDFDKRARYVDTLNGANCVAMMSSKYGRVLAMIPTDNIYWIEAIEGDDDLYDQYEKGRITANDFREKMGLPRVKNAEQFMKKE